MNTRLSRLSGHLHTFLWLQLFVALLAAIYSASTPATASAQGSGRVSGIIMNGTTDEPVSDVEVTLSRFEQVGPDSVDVSATTDDSGRFTFDGLDTAPGFAYAASVLHGRVLYSSGMILLSRAPEQQVEIHVYEPTADESVVAVLARGIVLSEFDVNEGTITVTDLYVVNNPSSRTYVGDDDGRTLRFHIPGNAVQVTPRPGFDFSNAMIEDATLYTTSPLRPGSTNATIDYTMPYSGSFARFPVRSSYPVEVVRILVPISESAEGVSVEATGATLIDGGEVEIEGNLYHVWTATGLAAGQSLNVTFSNLPETLVVHHQLRTVAPGLIALSVLVMASGVTGAVVVRRGLHRPRAVVLTASVAGPLDERRAELSAQLRELESRWVEGQLEEVEYRSERKMILEDLRKISRQYRGLGEDES